MAAVFSGRIQKETFRKNSETTPRHKNQRNNTIDVWFSCQGDDLTSIVYKAE
jgi:hypothetical protein